MGRRSRSSSSSGNSSGVRKHRKHDQYRSSRRSRSSSRHRRSSSTSGRHVRSHPTLKRGTAISAARSPHRAEVTVKKEPVSDFERDPGCSSTCRTLDERHRRSRVKEEVSSNGEMNRRNERCFDSTDHRRREAYRERRRYRSPVERKFDRQSRRSPIRWGRRDVKEEEPTPVDKEKPNFEITGALAADTNTYKGVVIKYSEPSEARKPKLRWALYPFKGDDPLPIYEIHRQSAYLFGRDRNIADIPVDHPSCSKQHAVFQYRSVPVELEDGTTVFHVKPYLIDLGSANGTYLNDERIEPQRYYELLEKDVFRFGYSTREYVLLNEKSVDDMDEKPE
uniref:FHA domain-containing protein n=1 Tax=Trichuris muris TaxID=70415 RepID=A0A5S6QNC7_TRIMR